MYYFFLGPPLHLGSPLLLLLMILWIYKFQNQCSQSCSLHCPASLSLSLSHLDHQLGSNRELFHEYTYFTFTFTFMHLADAFIQSDLHCIQVTVSTFYQLLLSLGIEPMILALLTPCSTSWATGKLSHSYEKHYTWIACDYHTVLKLELG